jgi:hypothetical protein
VPLLAAVRIEVSAQRAHGVADRSVVHVHPAPIGLDETGAANLCQVADRGLRQLVTSMGTATNTKGSTHMPLPDPAQTAVAEPSANSVARAVTAEDARFARVQCPAQLNFAETIRNRQSMQYQRIDAMVRIIWSFSAKMHIS